MRASKTRTWRSAWGGAAAACFVLPTFLTQGCDPGIQLETRTFELQHMQPEEALLMVQPYVYTERAGAPGAVTYFGSGITVRETPEALARIGEALAQYDRAKPGVRLHFQVIEADGFEDSDPRIEEVRSALEGLFRFEGYRLANETQMAMIEGTNSQQTLATDGLPMTLHAEIQEVRGSGSRGSVTVSVMLVSHESSGAHISTTLTVPVGQTIVLGSSKPTTSGPTTILTVRPEFVTLPGTGGS